MGLYQTPKNEVFGLLSIYRLIIKKGHGNSLTRIWFKLVTRFHPLKTSFQAQI
jgi:hypothetical protein